ncbi:hypothetical protein ACSBR1_035342 [Camellia fascicularis]
MPLKPCLCILIRIWEVHKQVNHSRNFNVLSDFVKKRDYNEHLRKEESKRVSQTSHNTSHPVPHLHCLIHWKLAVHDFLSSSPIMEVVEFTCFMSM